MAELTNAVPQMDGEDVEEWTGFDLDGTLAAYSGWKGIADIGEPLGADDPQSALGILKAMLAAGKPCRIFTTRAGEGPEAVRYIDEWMRKHCGQTVPVTNTKDHGMIRCYDDRCIQVDPKTGRPVR